MKWLIIILIVLAVLVIAGLIWSVAKRNKTQARTERAGELRSEAAGYGAERPTQEARARESQADAERVRAEAERKQAEADRLDARAQEEQRAYDQTRAQEEDAVREADRLDPNVDHKSDDYTPGNGAGHEQHRETADAPEGNLADPRYQRTEGDHRGDPRT